MADKITRDYVDLAEAALQQSRTLMVAGTDAEKAQISASQAIALAFLALVQKK